MIINGWWNSNPAASLTSREQWTKHLTAMQAHISSRWLRKDIHDNPDGAYIKTTFCLTESGNIGDMNNRRMYVCMYTDVGNGVVLKYLYSSLV